MHYYIFDRETKMVAAEAKDQSSLFQIQQESSPGAFESEYFVSITEEEIDNDRWLGYFPASWEKFVTANSLKED